MFGRRYIDMAAIDSSNVQLVVRSRIGYMYEVFQNLTALDESPLLRGWPHCVYLKLSHPHKLFKQILRKIKCNSTVIKFHEVAA